MKRFFLLMSACAVLVFATSSCRWLHENVLSVESCTEWYLDEIYEAGKSLDFGKIGTLSDQFATWASGLDMEDQAKATQAMYKWIEKNPIAAAALEGMGDLF